MISSGEGAQSDSSDHGKMQFVEEMMLCALPRLGIWYEFTESEQKVPVILANLEKIEKLLGSGTIQSMKGAMQFLAGNG